MKNNNRKKWRDLSREEKIRSGFDKKYKILLPIIFILIFIIMSYSINWQLQVDIKEDKTSTISISLQKEIYFAAMQQKKLIEAKGTQQYPNWQDNEETEKQYREYISPYYKESDIDIQNHYNISNDEYGKILLEGYNKQWTQ